MNGGWDVDLGPFAILVVCTGNVCRSPLAERVLQDGLDELAPMQFAVSSAGTQGLPDDTVTPEIAQIAGRYGLTFDGFASRRLEPGHIRTADLVLTMERAQRAAVVQMLPAALKRTFTLREFARILPLVPPIGSTTSSLPPSPGAAWRYRWASAASDCHRRGPPDDAR